MEFAMQSDRSRLRELEIRVANPQHWEFWRTPDQC